MGEGPGKMKQSLTQRYGRISARDPASRDNALLLEENARLQVRARALEEFERRVKRSFSWRCTKFVDRLAERFLPARSRGRKACNWIILLLRSAALGHGDRERLNIPAVSVLLSCLVRKDFGRIGTGGAANYAGFETGYEEWLERQDAVLTGNFARTGTEPGLVRVISVAPHVGADKTRNAVKGSGPEWQTTTIGRETSVNGLNGIVSSVPERWVIFLENSDYLHPHVPRVIRHVLSVQGDTELIYWDHDYTDGKRRRNPYFKPAWSQSLLSSQNYLGNAFAISKRLFECAGGFRELSVYDLLLRATSRNLRIVHVPRLLLSIDESLPRWLALDDRQSLSSAPAQQHGPLVSIIIPTRDKAAVLEKCLTTLSELTEYRNYEITVGDNSSGEPETASLFRRWEGRIRTMSVPQTLNVSAINNRAAAAAGGDLLLFLSNDVEVIEPQWLGAMVEQAVEPGAGAVGAKLLYPDGTIQHAGIVVGLSGLADNAFRGAPGTGTVYHDLENSLRECSAVTAACLLIRKSVFEEMNGFNENLPVCFNDVDLGIRLFMAGYRNVYVPSARLTHHESMPRGKTPPVKDTSEAFPMLGEFIRVGDPFYNPNLQLFGASFVRGRNVPRVV